VLLAEAPGAATVAADKAFDVPSFVAAVRARGITPHVARKVKYSAIDAPDDAARGLCHQPTPPEAVEQVFGWMKTVGGCGSCGIVAGDLADWNVTLAAAATT
jgi:hypothetical protein